MILSLLSLFRLFREAVEARIRAEDEARSNRLRAERAEQRNGELVKEIIDGKNKIIDALARRSLGNNVFTSQEAATEPPGEMKPIESRRVMARDLQQQQQQAFREKIKAYFEPDAA